MADRIRTEKDLAARLAQLENRCAELETRIKTSAGEIYHNVTHPAKIIKEAVGDLAADSNFRFDLLKVLTSLSAKFLANNKGAGKARVAFSVFESILDFFANRTRK